MKDKRLRMRILTLIDDLHSLDALFYVSWCADEPYPRFWLREWCGFKSWVSFATAESVRDAIWAGNLKAPKPCTTSPKTKGKIYPIKRSAPRLKTSKPLAKCEFPVIETVFVR